MDIRLNDAEVRVLGALVEKDITTPDYYPLSLNALINACNQRSNREPVMDLDEDAVRQALHALAEHGLAGPTGGADSRVTKYEHRLQEVYNFDRREIAVLCVLLLRGPQTPGELRGRTERMYPFEDLSQVQSTMQRLIDREPPLVSILPRQPGTKEARYMHLFGGDGSAGLGSDVSVVAAQAHSTASAGSNGERSSRLEDELALLRQEVDDLKRQFAEFRKQFE